MKKKKEKSLKESLKESLKDLERLLQFTFEVLLGPAGCGKSFLALRAERSR